MVWWVLKNIKYAELTQLDMILRLLNQQPYQLANAISESPKARM